MELIDIYKICFFVPATHLNSVKEAVFNAGAGKLGSYQHCCWQVKGTGQFKPTDSSTPFIGKAGVVEEVIEYKVEVICAKEYLQGALESLTVAHPYETPAVEVILLQIPASL